MYSDEKKHELGKKVASLLLDAEAVKINADEAFSWSSGWKSPIYCDNRITLSFPDTRTYIKEALSSMINTYYPKVEAIAGVATAGIPQGALVADKLGLPFIYVRSSPKGHGMENLIEGKISPGQKVVVLEDLVSTGGSSLKAATALQSEGFEVLGMASIFTYGFPIADDNFRKAGIDLIYLSNYDHILGEALGRDYINTSQMERLQSWRLSPETWK